MSDTPHQDREPSFRTTSDFVVPLASDGDWEAIEQVFNDVDHYTSAILATERVRREILGNRIPTGPIGPFAVRAFAMHLIQPAEGGIDVETIISVAHGVNDADFLRSLARPVSTLMPHGSFPFRLVSISRVLQQGGLKVAAGVYIGADPNDQTKEFVAMTVPRIYLDQFRPEHATDRHDFAVKLTATAFTFLSSEYLKSLEPDGTTETEARE